MRALILLATIVLAACGSSSGSNEPNPPEPPVNPPPAVTQVKIVPLPSSVELQNENLTLGLSANILVDATNTTSNAALQKLTTGLGISHNAAAPYRIELQRVTDANLGDEGYSLTIERDIIITAQTDAGLFYGVQSLRQLFPATASDTYSLPQLHITDVPQYTWRGSMIDVARNFFSLDYLKKHIERMALFKLNTLHLHLSDDQGWRMEIEAYPNLTTIGGSGGVGDSEGGFYTQAELIELVAFAAQHQVEIIPELDMPGHTQAAIASYNELACDDVTNLGLYNGTAVGFSALCLAKPDVIYPFVETVMAEVAAIFPSEYLHIGGDEIDDPLYEEFMEKANEIITALDRKMIGWEEASSADISSDSLLQLWNDNYDIQSALDRNIHLVLSPCSYLYLDHGNYNGQPETYTWCRAQGVPLERVYRFDPTGFSLVKGIEAPMWSELVSTEAAADNRLWPRTAAVAEIAWTAQADRDYDEFLIRLAALKNHLDALEIQYYEEPQLGW